MAGKSTLSPGGSFDPSCIDGVQVRISEKFLPPKKVTLPITLQTRLQSHNPSEVLFMEYDFSLEEAVIKWHTDYVQRNEEQAQKATKMAEELAVKELITGSTEATSSNPVENSDESPPATMVLPLLGPGEPPVLNMPQNTMPTKPNYNPYNNPMMAGMSTAILIPTQISTAKPKEMLTGKKGAINLADFERENEQDPFDNAELRVMNDLEELDKVLQNVASSSASAVSCGVSNVSETHPMPPGQSNSSYHNGQSQLRNLPQNDIHPQNYPAIPPRKNAPISIKGVDYPSLDSVECVQTSNIGAQAYSNPFYELASATQNNEPVYFAYGMHMTGAQYSNFANPFAKMTSTGSVVNTDGLQGIKPSNPQITEISTDNVTNPFLLSHGNGYPTRETLAYCISKESSKNGLRSVRSTPDISALADNAEVHFLKSHTPPPHSYAQKVPVNQHKVSTNPWGPPASHMVTPGAVSSINTKGHSPAGASSLLDPYLNLSCEKKSLVDRVTSMGFQRARVSRVVEKLGLDVKQVVDRLCLITRLCDKQFPAEDAEQAAGLYPEHEKQAEQYLRMLQRFKELGFTPESIKAALTESKLDENKTLDILTGNT